MNNTDSKLFPDDKHWLSLGNHRENHARVNIHIGLIFLIYEAKISAIMYIIKCQGKPDHVKSVLFFIRKCIYNPEGALQGSLGRGLRPRLMNPDPVYCLRQKSFISLSALFQTRDFFKNPWFISFRKQNKELFQTNIMEPILFCFAWRTDSSDNVTSVTVTSLCCCLPVPSRLSYPFPLFLLLSYDLLLLLPERYYWTFDIFFLFFGGGGGGGGLILRREIFPSLLALPWQNFVLIIPRKRKKKGWSQVKHRRELRNTQLT